MLKNRKKLLVAGLGAFVVICGLCGIISLFTTGSEEASPVQTEAPATDAIVVEPTDTVPVPTATARPTVTPEPTDTPLPTMAPTETAASKLSIDEQEYATKVADASMDFADWMGKLSDLSLDAGANPLLFLDDEWKTDVGTALGFLQKTSERMANVEPVPDRFKEIDNYMEQIHAETKLLVSNYARGVDEMDVDLLNSAVENINNINELSESATEELIRIAGEVLE